MAWQIDGGQWMEGEIAESLLLASNLPTGRHEVLLMVRGLDEHESRWQPPLVSSVTFLGFDVTNGRLVGTTRSAQPRIEFLGDSITEGVLVQPVSPDRSTWVWQTDGRSAYAAQTAMRLNAEWRQVGFGAQGLTHGGNGGTPAAPDAFDFFYEGVARDNWQADLVVINQGTNDRRAEPAQVQAAMSQLLTRVRAAYPAAHIVVMRPFNGTHETALRAAVAERVQSGDRRLSVIDTSGWLDEADFTDGVHPNVQGSGKICDHLVPILRMLLSKKQY